ncbi:hypothetical protein SAMN06313486_10167 [Epsilonproteobacteria bacterium SCGC AD-308-P11]|nr:hypothetical protein SAMN06313486_10167 [Epsilonproteobacteria bacterium SCGC AD-308-P11]
MKDKTWQKIGEVILNYSKILLGIGVISPFINNLNLENSTEIAIIVGVIILTLTEIVTYNKGVKDE